MTIDAELLRRYLEERSESAFAELVQRHLGLVYSAALRRTNCNHHLAEEVAQKVFTDLARKSAALKSHPALTGWLYRSTRYAAIDALRSELRRQVLTQNLQTMPNEGTQKESMLAWENLRPVLDEAMDQLKERDRELMLLRFFHGLTFSEVGQRLQLTENAARMRSERALEKLRVQLKKRGVGSSAAVLGTLLSNQAIAATPAGLSVSVSSAAIAAGPATGLAGIGTLIFMNKLTASFASAITAAALTAIVSNAVTKDYDPEIVALHNEHARLTQATAANAPIASAAAIANEYATQAIAIAHAFSQRQASISGATASPTTGKQTEVTPRGHRDHGIDTPHNAAMTFAFACDTADPSLMAKLIYFDDATRAEAQKMLATMPDAIRTQYPTAESFYGLCLAAACIEAPPPGADLMERFMVIAEVGPGRIATRRLGSSRNVHEYKQTAEGWKYVVPLVAVKYAPLNLASETLAKLSAK